MTNDTGKYPATAQVLQWIENEKQKGLVDIKFDACPRIDSTLESFSSDVLGMLNAKTLPAPEDFNTYEKSNTRINQRNYYKSSLAR